jgi:hypothetical protein
MVIYKSFLNHIVHVQNPDFLSTNRRYFPKYFNIHRMLDKLLCPWGIFLEWTINTRERLLELLFFTHFQDRQLDASS